MTLAGRTIDLAPLLLCTAAIVWAGGAPGVQAQATQSGDAALATAQVATPPPEAARPAARHVDGEKILRLLVAKGLISAADAESLESEATVEPAPAASIALAGGVVGDVQTIPYIPETVRRQIKDELRAEVKSDARKEGWAQPGLIPEWLGKVTLFGDLRVRDEEALFDKGNDPNIVNFAALNAGPPFNINRSFPGSANPSFLNTTQDRNRVRIRARIGLVARPDDWIAFEVRGSTGNDISPVSPNQTLGSGGGQFSKYSIWLDRANVDLTPVRNLHLTLGRFENPFWSTALVFYPDLNFDGAAVRYRRDLGPVEAFATLGAFPVFNTDFNFGSRDVGAFPSRDKWLYAGQIGASGEIAPGAKLTGAVGYFDFETVEGKVSGPCAFNQDVCDTDPTRPQFQQFGNSLYPIRNIVPDPTAVPGLSPNPQYFGLASPFRLLDVHAALDLGVISAVPVRLEGDFVDNLAFNRSLVLSRQINSTDPAYRPGSLGWYGSLTAGKPVIEHFGDWSATIGYRYIETDAVVDGLADADFHLGGTNAKGFVLMGYYGIGKGTSIGARWFSADTITGAPYSNDVLQFDLNTRF